MNKKVVYSVLLGLGLIAPYVVYPVFMMKVLCFALFACAFNLLVGYAGLLSFGHAAFLGMAGYVTGYMLRDVGLPLELGILAGVVAAAALGFVFGALAIRRQGIYFAMVTLALSQMVYFFCITAPFTGGENGLQGVPRGHFLGVFDLSNNMNMYYFVFGVFVFGFWVVHRTIHSPFGQILRAIKDNEPRAISLGYEVARYKLVAFVISAALSGLAGSTKTVALQLASLTDVHWHMSGEVVLINLLGGMGTVLGPVFGATLVVSLQNYLASGALDSWVPVVLGFIFVVCVLAFRRGIVGEVQRVLKQTL